MDCASKDFVSKNISMNLKRIRKARRLSLDEVAEQTGVSKSMLGQIERGDSNPTVATVAKIVDGMRVTFSTLIKAPGFETYHIKKAELAPAKTEKGQYKVYNVFPFEEDRSFEIYLVEICVGGRYQCGSHGEGTQEYLTIHSGSLSLDIDGSKSVLAENGDTIRFMCDKPHCYKNIGNEPLTFTIYFTFGQKFF